ncbi:hypothetical protein GQ55_2G023300 [Panicum hallii var. hallii]|uniref:Uncharacterized protein n=1 Tax=Panicum hallii var. hallii TaxID=1504633 RepID=A0A2T7EKM0_9POAL|nr:hypothetical protein GQ55_2G023300 [Panicum hallii var. hallii]
MQMQCIISRLFLRWIDLLTNFLRMRERERELTATELERSHDGNPTQVWCRFAVWHRTKTHVGHLLGCLHSRRLGRTAEIKTCSSADHAHATMTKRTKNFGCIGLNLLRSLLKEEAGRRNLLPVILSSFLCFSFDVQ